MEYQLIFGLWEFYFILCFLLNIPSKVHALNKLGHDMKAEINRRCTPYFNVLTVVQKK